MDGREGSGLIVAAGGSDLRRDTRFEDLHEHRGVAQHRLGHLPEVVACFRLAVTEGGLAGEHPPDLPHSLAGGRAARAQPEPGERIL